MKIPLKVPMRISFLKQDFGLKIPKMKKNTVKTQLF